MTTTNDLILLPRPRFLTYTGGTLDLPETGTIQLAVPRAADALFTARMVQSALKQHMNANWALAGGSLPGVLTLGLNPGIRTQGYTLTIAADSIQIIGGDLAGLYYGACTFVQILRTRKKTLPQLVITDYPDLQRRGVMLDVSRDKVPTMDTLYELIDTLSTWKINEFQLYMEHTFAYRNHKKVWENASPFTPEEILALDAYCRERYIDLVPNQNSFGHWSRWFMHPEYLHLAETDIGITSPWGSKQEYPFSLAPAVPETLPLLDELFDELLPNFSSKMFNVGADETFDVGEGKSKALVEAKGKGRVYLDFLLELYKRTTARGRTMQFWGDIINEHPELVSDLPKDVIALEWGYDHFHDFDTNGARFATSGIPFYTCPGTSTWVSISGRTDNMLINIRNAAVNGVKHGAIGLLNTAWGDLGHWQQFPADYPGFAYGAAASWYVDGNVDIDLAAVLDTHVFFDQAGVMGKLALGIGNTYKQTGVIVGNSNLLRWAYKNSVPELRDGAYRFETPESKATMLDDTKLMGNLLDTIAYVRSVMQPLENANMQRADAPLIEREYAMMARMLTQGARMLLMQLGESANAKPELRAELESIEADFRALWTERNRIGGLSDSAALLHKARKFLE